MKLKITWFLFHVALQRKSTQLNGTVWIDAATYFSGTSQSIGPSTIKYVKLFWNSLTSLPVKHQCYHVCVSSTIIEKVYAFNKRFWCQETKLRWQLHSSISTSTILKKLEGFGLCRDALPKSIGGNYDEKQPWIIECERLLQKRKAPKRRRQR